MQNQSMSAELCPPSTNAPSLQGSRPLRRYEASEYLFGKYGIKRTPATLAKLAVIGGGPLFRKANRTPLYDVASLDMWAESLLTPLKASTSDTGVEG